MIPFNTSTYNSPTTHPVLMRNKKLYAKRTAICLLALLESPVMLLYTAIMSNL